ncbi:MAG: MbnP family protein [Bacteroidia bacterium]
MKNFYAISTFLILLSWVSCKPNEQKQPDKSKPNPLDTVTNFSGILINKEGSISISINHQYDGKPLLFDSVYYTMASGDTINVERLRYYISNITLVEPNGNEQNLKSYHLINPKVNRNLTFKINNVKPGIYNKIKYLIGIDSLTNSTRVGSGEIDPALGMFWDWNTGYIFYQIEGRTAKGDVYSLHLGGNGNQIKIEHNIANYKLKSTNPIITLNLNYSEVFKNPITYDFKIRPMQMHMPTSPAAPIMRDNLADVLMIADITP